MKMKNLKRGFAMALASMMALSMCTMTAFAEGEEEEGSTVVTEIPVAKCISVKDGAAIPERTFTFNMVPATEAEIDGATYQGQTIEAGKSLREAGTVSYTFSSSDTATVGITTDTDTNGNTITTTVISGDSTKNQNGTVTKKGLSFDLTEANFDHSGVYRYFITEVIPDDVPEYITYSTDKYIVDLYVFGDKDEEKNTIYVAKGLTVTKDGASNTTLKPQDIIFTNTIHDSLLTISKTVEGEEYTKDELFDFWIEIPEGGDTINLDEGTEIYAKIYNGTNWVKDDRSNEDGLVVLKVKGDINNLNVQGDGTKFQLKNGEELRIYAPITMIYYVQEKDYSGEGYTQTYNYLELGSKVSNTLKNNTDGTAVSCFETDEKGEIKKDEDDKYIPKTIKGTVNSTTNTVSFINTRNFTAPNTGLNLDMIPYVLITLIAVCGSILFFTRKRRVDR